MIKRQIKVYAIIFKIIKIQWFKMQFKVKLLIWCYYKVQFLKAYLLSVLRISHESVLCLSTLKWSFILLMLYYLQLQFKYTFTFTLHLVI